MRFKFDLKKIIKNNNSFLKNKKQYINIRGYNNQKTNKEYEILNYLKLKFYKKIDDYNYQYMFNDIKYLKEPSINIDFDNNLILDENVKDNDCHIHFVNTGNGDAICIENSGECAIIDFGGLNGAFNDYLNKNIRQDKIKYSFITHFHSDHLKDFFEVSKSKDLEMLVLLKDVNDEMIEKDLIQNISKIEKSNARHIRLIDTKEIEERKAIFNLGNTALEILWPRISDGRANNNSLVIKMDFAGRSILFTGDIESKAEIALKNVLKIDFNLSNIIAIKVSHHGSNKSSSEEFLQIFENVEDFIVLLNENRAWQNNDTIERLQKHGNVYQSYKDGNIRLDISKEGEVSVVTEFNNQINKEEQEKNQLNFILKQYYQDLHLHNSEFNNYLQI